MEEKDAKIAEDADEPVVMSFDSTKNAEQSSLIQMQQIVANVTPH
jgi:hypothetical protein